MSMDSISKINYQNPFYTNAGISGVNANPVQPVKQQTTSPYDNMSITDKMALLTEYQATGQINPFAMPPVEAVSATQGFSLPSNNGTGELQPVVEGRADEIEGCPWDEYYA